MYSIEEFILIYCQISPFLSFIGYIFLIVIKRLVSVKDVNFFFFKLYIFINLGFIVIFSIYFLVLNLNYNSNYYIYISYGFISYSLCFNFISLSMLVLVSCVSFIVHLYSLWYMQNDVFLLKFLAYLSFFTGSMLVLVLGNSLLQMFIGWELVGISSFLLISFWNLRREALRAACKALFLNKIGDFFFLIGIVLIFKMVGSFDFSIINFFLNELISYSFYNFLFIDLILICFFLAATAKSAQFGLHMWLIDAMEGPTPVSALIHAATMVTAGIYLLIKINFLICYCSYLIVVFICFWGAITAFMGGFLAIIQYDIKKIIAYSTMSQLGYMMSIVCIYPDIALYHLINHGWFKALLFLAAGVVIHGNNNSQDIRSFQPYLFLRLPVTFFIFIVGSLAMVALPLTSGFFSKDVIYEVIIISKGFIGCYLLLFFSGFFTITYSIRLVYYVFFKKGFCYIMVKVGDLEPGYVIFTTYIFLVIMSVCSGYIYNFLLVNINFFVDLNLYFFNCVYIFFVIFYFSFIHKYFVGYFSFFSKLHWFFFNRLGLDFFINILYSKFIYYCWFLYFLIENGFIQIFFGPMYSLFFRYCSNYVVIFESFDSLKLIIITIILFICITLFI